MRLCIAICDDELTETEYLANLVQEWSSGKVSTVISVYGSAEAFLFAYSSDKSIDILLLDIQMKKLDGITLAKQLRANGDQIQIIFITGLHEFIAEGYEVSALHYLMKPISKEKLFCVLDRAFELLSKKDEYILVETKSGLMRIFHRDIHYVEAFAHATVLQIDNGGIEVRLNIGELEALLGGGFCRVHRSYLVGLHHIRQITKTDVIMDSGKALPLSRRRYAAVNKAFIQYYKEENDAWGTGMVA